MATVIGPLHVRRSILISASPAEVWRQFETPERVKAWLNLGHTLHKIELQVGGEVELSVEIDGGTRFFGGRVLTFDVEQELTFVADWYPPHAFAVPTFWTLRLSPIYGMTQVELFHHGFERLGADAADHLQGYEQGWDVKHLTALRAIVEG